MFRPQTTQERNSRIPFVLLKVGVESKKGKDAFKLSNFYLGSVNVESGCAGLSAAYTVKKRGSRPLARVVSKNH